KPTRAASEVDESHATTAAHHQSDAVQRLQRAQQNSSADPHSFARDIKEIVQAIDKVNVRMSTFKIERPIACGATTQSVSSFIAYHVGFGLDDAPTCRAPRKVVHESFSDQIACEPDCVDGQLGAPKAADLMSDAPV